jgi:hypothetical protein
MEFAKNKSRELLSNHADDSNHVHEINESGDSINRHCPNCGMSVSQTADICENCGEWLLKGKCNFCYADIEEGQNFCAECGNPPKGIICRACGKLSHFDFCPNCNLALSEQANDMIEIIKKSEEFNNLFISNDNPTPTSRETASNIDQKIDKLKEYIARTTEQKSKKKNLFILTDASGVDVDNNLRSIEQSRQQLANDEQTALLNKQKELQAIQMVEATKNKTFSSNQEARKFFGALKILLPQIIRKQVPTGWTCNAYSCTHLDGPQGCADPSQGGVWSYESTTERNFIEMEI